MLFKIYTKNSQYFFDNYLSTFYQSDLQTIDLNCYHITDKLKVTRLISDNYFSNNCIEKPSNFSFKDKKPLLNAIKWLDLIVGNKCNYRCKYCIQHEHKENVFFSKEKFFKLLVASGLDFKNQITKIRLWGGEALLYKEALVSLIKFLRYNLDYGKSILLITNGSLFDESFCSFCLDYDVKVSFSHDGPGHKYYRNLNDYLDNTSIRNAIIRQLKAKQSCKGWSESGLIMPVLNRKNYKLEKTVEWFNKKLYDGCPVFMDTLFKADQSNKYLLDQYTKEDFLNIENEMYRAMLCNEEDPYYVYYHRLRSFKDTTKLKIFNAIPYSSLTARCPSHHTDERICFDLMGRHLTCYADQSQWGNAYGSLEYIEKCGWNLRSLQDRKSCLNCPYVVTCMGMCPLLDDKNHLIRCKSQLPIIKAAFKAAFFELFGEEIISIEPYYETNSMH